MESTNQPANGLPPAFEQIFTSMLEMPAQASAALDHAVAEMKGAKDTTLAEFSTHKSKIVNLMKRSLTETFERIDTSMTFAEKEFSIKLNEVVEQEMVKVNDARKPLVNIPEQIEAMRA